MGNYQKTSRKNEKDKEFGCSEEEQTQRASWRNVVSNGSPGFPGVPGFQVAGSGFHLHGGVFTALCFKRHRDGVPTQR